MKKLLCAAVVAAGLVAGASAFATVTVNVVNNTDTNFKVNLNQSGKAASTIPAHTVVTVFNHVDWSDDFCSGSKPANTQYTDSDGGVAIWLNCGGPINGNYGYEFSVNGSADYSSGDSNVQVVTATTTNPAYQCNVVAGACDTSATNSSVNNDTVTFTLEPAITPPIHS